MRSSKQQHTNLQEVNFGLARSSTSYQAKGLKLVMTTTQVIRAGRGQDIHRNQKKTTPCGMSWIAHCVYCSTKVRVKEWGPAASSWIQSQCKQNANCCSESFLLSCRMHMYRQENIDCLTDRVLVGVDLYYNSGDPWLQLMRTNSDFGCCRQ